MLVRVPKQLQPTGCSMHSAASCVLQPARSDGDYSDALKSETPAIQEKHAPSNKPASSGRLQENGCKQVALCQGSALAACSPNAPRNLYSSC
mmetsp:Transcript_146170/g.269802  ORF Transcript_146170/g.269802 Transcript_146170/m.269802 type:complete len:92 (-) Transcript_146170:252-527(-)